MSATRSAGDLVIRPATKADLPAINRIYKHEVLHGVATFDIEPWSDERRRDWFEEHSWDRYPVLVADDEDACAGYACLSPFRPKPGYRYTRENSVYVAPPYQRRGLGQRLLDAIVAEARRLDTHTLVARIDAENEGSILIHRRAGYELTGREHEVGHKFGRWLSVVVMTLALEGPAPG